MPTASPGWPLLLFGADESTVYLSPAPLYHAAPLRFCRAVHRLGGTVIVMEHFDPEQYLALVAGAPGDLQPGRADHVHPDAEAPRGGASALRPLVAAGGGARGGAVPAEVKAQIIEWFGPVIHEYYAGTEGNGFVYCNSTDWLAHPAPWARRSSAPSTSWATTARRCPPASRAPSTSRARRPRPSSTTTTPRRRPSSADPKGRGWSTLGDVGYLDDDGFLYLTDRKAYMIITGGVNVYPQEAENVLALHPKVNDVAVFGVPNDDFGEEVKAVVEPVSMDDAGPDLERELIAYCKEHLADVKCPRSVDFRPELPRHPTGKLYKRLLKDEYWAAAGRAI